MKYYIFFATLIGCFLFAYLLSLKQFEHWRKWTLSALPLVMIFWEKTAINFFSNETYRGTARGMEISLIHLVAGALLLSRILARKPIRFWTPGMWTYGLYFLVTASTMIWATNPLFAWFEVWKMIMMGGVFLAIYNEVLDDGDIYPILIGLMGVVWISFLTGLVQRYVFGVHQVNGIFPHRNSMGMFMVLIGPIFFLGWFLIKERYLSYLCCISFVMSALSVFLSLSRGSLIFFPLGCILASPGIFVGRWVLRKTLIILILGISVMVVAIRLAPRIIERFETAPEASTQTRVDLANLAVAMTQRHPAGVGVNNWSLHVGHERYAKFHTMQYGTRHSAIVETIYLLVSAECGYMGIGALLLFFSYFLILVIRLIHIYVRTPYTFFVVGSMGGLVAVYLQSAFEWVLKQSINFTELLIIFALLNALLSLRHHIQREEIIR